MILTKEQLERIIELFDRASERDCLDAEDYLLRGELITAMFKKHPVSTDEEGSKE